MLPAILHVLIASPDKNTFGSSQLPTPPSHIRLKYSSQIEVCGQLSSCELLCLIAWGAPPQTQAVGILCGGSSLGAHILPKVLHVANHSRLPLLILGPSRVPLHFLSATGGSTAPTEPKQHPLSTEEYCGACLGGLLKDFSRTVVVPHSTSHLVCLWSIASILLHSARLWHWTTPMGIGCSSMVLLCHESTDEIQYVTYWKVLDQWRIFCTGLGDLPKFLMPSSGFYWVELKKAVSCYGYKSHVCTHWAPWRMLTGESINYHYTASWNVSAVWFWLPKLFWEWSMESVPWCHQTSFSFHECIVSFSWLQIFDLHQWLPICCDCPFQWVTLDTCIRWYWCLLARIISPFSVKFPSKMVGINVQLSHESSEM